MYRTYAHNRKRSPNGFRPTRVAVIDNGILSISPKSHDKGVGGVGDSTGGHASAQNQNAVQGDPSAGNEPNQSLWSRIRGGRSFVDEHSTSSPWLFASHPHGT